MLSSLTKLYSLSAEIEKKIKGYPTRENPYIFLRISCKQTIDSITRVYLSNVALKFYWACTRIKGKTFDLQECLTIFKSDTSVLDIADSLGLKQLSFYEKDPLELEQEQRLKKELGEYYQYKERKARAFSNNYKILTQVKKSLLEEFTFEELKAIYDTIQRGLISLDVSNEIQVFLRVLKKVLAVICHDQVKKSSKKKNYDQIKMGGF